MKISKQTKKNSPTLIFFIGTEAEFIKLFPVLHELDIKGIHYKIISSGQNNISESLLFTYISHKKVDLTLSSGPKKQTPGALLGWFLVTFVLGYFQMKMYLRDILEKPLIVVHGDTVSTVMGAYLGKLLGLKVAHIEAGLRSFNFRHPFPEEIDRVLTSKVVDIHFSPNEWAINNLKNHTGEKVNTMQNTLLDSLRLVTQKRINTPLLKKVKNKKYFVFVMHRQENLANEVLVNNIISLLVKQTKNLTCVFILHKPTKVALEQYKLLDKVENNKWFITTPRLGYAEIMNLFKHAEFLITDGGSNQEEAYYMGKPCLILRKFTERTEGLGSNVLLSYNNLKTLKTFLSEYKKYERRPIESSKSPSRIIVNYLLDK